VEIESEVPVAAVVVADFVVTNVVGGDEVVDVVDGVVDRVVDVWELLEELLDEVLEVPGLLGGDEATP
jgi:hypothetical protein